MTIAVSNNTPRVSYTVSQGATQTSFTVSFEFFAEADLNVYVDGTLKTITSDYTVSGGNGSTGTVTMSVTGATGGSTVVITRDIALERTTDFPTQGAFNISSLNTELDKLVAIDADVDDTISRSIRLKDQDDSASMELPLKASRVGTVMAFNATTGAVEAGPSISSVTTVATQSANINTVAGISSNVTTVAGIQANVTTVAGIASNVTTVAGAISNINALAASDVITDMSLLATSDVIADMALLANADVIADMNTLAVTDVINDINLLATSDIVSDLNTLATSDIVSDINTLATSDIVSDLNTLATSDIVSDINTLATSDIVTDLNLLATSDFVSDLNTLATTTNVNNISTVAGISSNISTVAGISANVTTVAGIQANVTSVAGIASNVTTVASNISGVNSFADRYRVASSAPTSSLDVGDLYFDTTANELKVYKSSGWAAAGSTVNGTSARFTYNISGTPTSVTGADANGNTLAYDAGFIDVYLNGVRLSGADITITSGDTVTFASALADGDLVDIVAFGTFSVANITSTGALNSGSITSGFGNIDTGSSTITTTGAISGGALSGTSLDLNGGELILDADNDTSITADTDDQIDFKTGGTDRVVIDSSGKVLLGTTQQRGHMTLQIEGDGSGSTAQGSIFLRRGLSTSSIGGNVGADLGLIQFGDNDGGIYAKIEAKSDASAANNDYPGRLQFFTTADGASSPTERMRIDSSGNVGISAIPSGEAAAAHVVRLGDQVCIAEYDDGSNPEQFNLFHNSDSSETYIETGTASVIQQRAGEIIFKNAASGSAGAAISFAERMRLTSTGRLLLGTTDDVDQAMRIKVDGSSPTYGIKIHNSKTSSTRNFIEFGVNSSFSPVGSIKSNGSSTSYNTSSDYRLKENVVTDWDATTRLKQLKPSRFNFKINKDQTVDGFLAHEVSSIVPEAVTGEKDAMTKEVLYVDEDKIPEGKKVGDVKTPSDINPQGIDQSKLVPLLTKALQEALARIETLEAKVTALEGK